MSRAAVGHVGWPSNRCPLWICSGFDLTAGAGSPTPCIGLSHGGTRLYVLDIDPSPREVRVFDFTPPAAPSVLIETIVLSDIYYESGDPVSGAQSYDFTVTDEGDIYYWATFQGQTFWRQPISDRTNYQDLISDVVGESFLGLGWNPYDGHVWDLRETTRGTVELWRFNTSTDTYDANPITLDLRVTGTMVPRVTMPIFTSDGAIWCYIEDNDTANNWHRVDPDTLTVTSMVGTTTNGPSALGLFAQPDFDGVGYVGVPTRSNTILTQAGPSDGYPDGGPGLVMASDGTTSPYGCEPMEDPDLVWVTGYGTPIEFVTLAGTGRIATTPGHTMSAFIWPGVPDWNDSYFPGGPNVDHGQPGDLWVLR